MKIFIVSVIGVLFLAGCAGKSTSQISAFGNSTKALTEKVDAVFDEYNDASLSQQFTSAATIYNGSYAKGFNTSILAGIYKPFTPDVKKKSAIFKANQALGDYAQALADLASAVSRTDIDQATADLYSSMVSINGQYKTIKETEKELFDTEQLATISKFIAAIGSAILEEKRRKAIKEIVVSAYPKITIICDEINTQLKLLNIAELIRTSKSYQLTEEVIEYKSRVKKSTTLDWRRSEIKRLYGLYKEILYSKLLTQQTQQAIVAVKNSHALLAKELKEDKFTSASIASAIGELKELEKHYNDYEALLLSCETKIIKNDEGVLVCKDK